MADFRLEDFTRGRPDLGALRSRILGTDRATRLARLVGTAAAMTSAALIVGLGYWGYGLVMRDVAGVPVIQALTDPARVAPLDPGGELARHTGLAVNTVAAEGTAAAPADRLALAPPPAELGEAALTMSALRPQARALTPVAEAGDAVASDPGAAELVAAAMVMPDTSAPLAEPLNLIAADVPGVARSLRPRLRPLADATAPAILATIGRDAVNAALAEALAPEPPGGAASIDPASLPSGASLAQLGAYDDAAMAAAEWERIEVMFGPLMQDKGRMIQEAGAGGKPFYRLRVAGFADMAEARKFCAALLAGNTSCIATQTP